MGVVPLEWSPPTTLLGARNVPCRPGMSPLVIRPLSFAGACAVSVFLAGLFWGPLWTGGGVIGGDTYTYYFPQKVVYAEALREGRIPLWNPLVSFGYPQHAESQTGALYLPHLLLYRLLPVNAAYNATHLLHYIAAWVAAWLLGRRLGLGHWGAGLAATVFVYGWFPPRACLEWAIFGGVWFPAILWCAESYLQTGRQRWLIATALALSQFLLAGHFNLAFIALATTSVYLLVRTCFAKEGLDPRMRPAWKPIAGWLVAVTLGFGLAAPQLLPTVELKSLSQRDSYEKQTYGHLPPWYLSQALWPLMWYGPDMNPDQALWSTNWGSPPAPDGSTNKIEAHLYFSAAGFYLLVAGGLAGLKRGARPTRRGLLWAGLGLGAVVMATGWPVLWLKSLPGVSFFAGPGRYGIVTTWAVALGAGAVLDRLLGRIRGKALRGLVVAAIGGLCVVDLWFVSRWVTNIQMIPDPPIKHVAESEVRRLLAQEPAPVRLFAPGPNLPTLLGVNCVPEYLGIGPAAYYDTRLAIPSIDERSSPEDIQRQVRWLQQAGVTHVLRYEPLDLAVWPVETLGVVDDRFLNAAWARFRQPLYLYRLRGPRPRAFVEGDAEATVTFVEQGRERIVLDVDSAGGGELALLDLSYPGWRVEIDGASAESATWEDMFRSTTIPPGRHRVEWRYAPRSVWLGAVVGGASLCVLAGWCWLRLTVRRRALRSEASNRSSAPNANAPS
ncbi:MAG: hypothetical protein KF774_14425 [Planctomyces sp.]|nr:hypothetical protein [Planctomyces sp.]